MDGTGQLDIAVVGSGISGLAAAWLLGKRHKVALYEANAWLGGHSHTVEALGVPVDTGFIVYNEATYPNLTALFAHLGVETRATSMSFAVSLDEGRLEYAGGTRGGLFAQRRNLARPRFWAMLRDLRRFYHAAPRDLATMGSLGLGDYLDGLGCGSAFRDDHLYPMAAAIWSTPVCAIPDYPAAAFVRFCENHGLLRLKQRPQWRTVTGGSREYVARLREEFRGAVRTNCEVKSVRRHSAGVTLETAQGTVSHDRVVVAAHADQALAMLRDASAEERQILGAFGYRRNRAVLHSDPALMPRRRRVWSSWNYAAHAKSDGNGRGLAPSVTYWMNRLQHLPADQPLFVTLNPLRGPDPALVHWRGDYYHPVFDVAAGRAQARLWELQGNRHTWFCGAHFGPGFHEDGLQAGLAVAEQLGGVRRPWSVAEESARIHLPVRELEAA
jgi:predicted NAD/FAD-binding protein